jgi:hypothetical protein
MYKVYRQREIQDEFGAGDEQKNKYNTIQLCQRTEYAEPNSFIPDEAIQQPNQSKCPSDGRIAAKTAPTQDEFRVYLFPSYQSGKDDEDAGACIVERLENDNLGQDTER